MTVSDATVTDTTYNSLIGLYVHNSLDKALKNSSSNDIRNLLDVTVQHHFNFDNDDLKRILSNTKCVNDDAVYNVVNNVLHDIKGFESTIYCMKKIYYTVEPRFNILHDDVNLSNDIHDDLNFVVRNYPIDKITSALGASRYSSTSKVINALVDEYKKNGRFAQTIRLTNPDLNDVLKDFQ